MKLTLPYYRIFLQVSLGLVLVMCFWSLGEIFHRDALQQEISRRTATRDSLSLLEADFKQLSQLSDRWAVGGAMSFEIRQTITSGLRDATFPDPVLVGSHRLHRASVRLPEESAGDAFDAFTVMRGLPVRTQNIDLAVDGRGRISGTIDVVWLERL